MTQVSRKGFRDKNGKQVVLKDPTKADKAEDCTEGNFACLDESGNLQDSGKSHRDFASNDHEHTEIKAKYGATKEAKVYCSAGESTEAAIRLKIKTGPISQKIVELKEDNIDNLSRALNTPSSSPEDDDTKLITSKAVYDAIEALKDVETIQITRDIGANGVAFILDSIVLTNIRSIISRHNVPQTYIPVIVLQHNGTSLTGKDALGYMYFERDFYEVDEQDVTEFDVYVYVAGLVLVFRNHTPGDVNVPSEDLTTWEDYDPLSPNNVGSHNFLD